MIDLGDTTFRPLLASDMLDAWALTKVHFDRPQTEGSFDDVPRGFIQLLNVEPSEQRPRGFNRRALWHRYRLIGQFQYPEEGTLEEAKTAKASELLAVLTAGDTIYERSGEQWRYWDVGVPVEEANALDDAVETVYHVMVDFTLEWVTGT